MAAAVSDLLLLKLLQPLRLVHLQPTVLLTPTEVSLLHDTGFFTRQSSRLPVRYAHFDLPQQIYYLLRLALLPSSQMLSFVQCLSSPLAHFKPGTLHVHALSGRRARDSVPSAKNVNRSVSQDRHPGRQCASLSSLKE
jgi:hypothetical protein